MKKIINGKIYDTATAKRLGSHDNGFYPNDLYYAEETLYQKRTGEFFLHGEGGAGSKYSKSVGFNSWVSSEMIIPLTFTAAKEWAEENLEADDYEQIFGEIAEDESKTSMCISISSEKAETIRRRASEAGITISAYLESLIK